MGQEVQEESLSEIEATFNAVIVARVIREPPMSARGPSMTGHSA
jgi:hypothetical protein